MQSITKTAPAASETLPGLAKVRQGVLAAFVIQSDSRRYWTQLDTRQRQHQGGNRQVNSIAEGSIQSAPVEQML